jgi:starvation-inducible DNA-binding protein
LTDTADVKTSIVTVPQNSMDADTASGVQQYLGGITINCQALVLDGKQAHWHVRGENFIAVHRLLDEVVQHAQAYADLAAERTVALGLPIDARVQTVAAKTTTPVMKPGFQHYDVMIQQVVAQVDATLKVVRDAVKGLEDIDPNSQDVATEIERGLTEDRWFLAAHLATS